MYSDEDRQAILELLRESGMPPGRFARESGLASETALRGWLSGSPRVGWHPPYTVAQRAEAARRALACVLSTRFEQNEHRNLSSLRTRRAQAF